MCTLTFKLMCLISILFAVIRNQILKKGQRTVKHVSSTRRPLRCSVHQLRWITPLQWNHISLKNGRTNEYESKKSTEHDDYDVMALSSACMFVVIIFVVAQLNENSSHRLFSTLILSFSSLKSVNSCKKKKSYPFSQYLQCVRVCIDVRLCHVSSTWNVIKKNDYEWHVHTDRPGEIKIKGRINAAENENEIKKHNINNKLKRS